MGESLTGQTPKDTYQQLAHFGDAGAFPADGEIPLKLLKGDGTESPLAFTETKMFLNGAEITPTPKANYTATAPPAVTDDEGAGYSVGSTWFDTVGKEAYRCVDATGGAAVWIESTFDGAEVQAMIDALLAADNDWTGLQVFAGGFTVNSEMVLGPSVTFTYISSAAAHRAALADGSASTGTGGLVRAISPTLDSPIVTGNLTVDTNTLFVDATNNRVGVGSASPAEKLSVDGNAAISGFVSAGTAATYGAITCVGGTSFAGILPANGTASIGRITTTGWDGSGFIFTNSFSGTKAFSMVYNADRAYFAQLTTGGYAGDIMCAWDSVGMSLGSTADPVNRLNVNGAASIGTSYISTAGPANGLIVQGNVGIGTSSPSATLDVVGSTRTGTYTVATTPPHFAGAEILISNATGAAIGSAVAGTGSQLVKAASNGTQWICTAIIIP